MTDYIFHIAHKSEWEARTNGLYKPAAFEMEDFIHCSTQAQIIDTANTFYSKENDLVLLLIDANKVSAEIKYENLVGGEKQFPHIYGELNEEAVARVYAFEQNENGKFDFPAELLKDIE